VVAEREAAQQGLVTGQEGSRRGGGRPVGADSQGGEDDEHHEYLLKPIEHLRLK
jgi:hypothetical protein